MSILNGIAQIGTVLNTTRDIIEALKPQSRSVPVHRESGSTSASSGTKGRTEFSAELNKAAARYIALRDVNKDGTLNATELGLGGDVFTQIDLNADGRLSLAELSQAASTNPGLINLAGSTAQV